MRLNEKIKILRQMLAQKSAPSSPKIFMKYIKGCNKKALLHSAQKYGTPQYVLDKKQLQERIQNFKETFRKCVPQSDFFYAFKCNDFPELLKTVKSEGFNADVAGLFEIQLAKKLNFPAIIYSSPGKTKEELQYAVHEGIIISLDNLDEIDLLISLKAKARVSIRINFNTTNSWSKFGIRLPELKQVIRKLEKTELMLVGLHFHSSWNYDPTKYTYSIRKIGAFLKKNRGVARQLQFLDMGGGFEPEGMATLSKFSYRGELLQLIEEYSGKKTGFNLHGFSLDEVDLLTTFANRIGNALNIHIFNVNPAIRIWLEPGRYIATHSTTILVKVLAVKGDSVIVDGGINMVGDYRFDEYLFAPILNISQPSANLKRKTVYGPLCDPSDVWGFFYFGKSIKKGDILAVLHQGAYTFSCAWRFIKPIPRYIVIDGKKIYCGKEEEKFNERYAGTAISGYI